MSVIVDYSDSVWRRHSCLRVAEGKFVAAHSNAPLSERFDRDAEHRNARPQRGALRRAQAGVPAPHKARTCHRSAS
jgi:hypothetical protein